MRAAPLPALPAMLLPAIASLARGHRGSLPAGGLHAGYAIAPLNLRQVAEYRRILDYPGSDLPLTYFYLLAQRAQLALMLDGQFPFAIPGLIHVGNDMFFQDTPHPDHRLEASVSVMSLPEPGLAEVRKIVFRCTLSQAGHAMIHCTSEYLAGKRRRSKSAGSTEPGAAPAVADQAAWGIAGSDARRYARLSGDYNPIHLSGLLARAFGFERAIMHGMHATGLAAAAIERHSGRQVVAIAARFKHPILLPARIRFSRQADGPHAGNYLLRTDGQRIHVSGSYAVA